MPFSDPPRNINRKIGSGALDSTNKKSLEIWIYIIVIIIEISNQFSLFDCLGNGSGNI